MSKKVLLLGRSEAGKTSMKSVIFANYFAKEVETLGSTINVENTEIPFMGKLSFALWDCGGQKQFMKSYFSSQQSFIFSNVTVLIYVFDLKRCLPPEYQIPPKDLRKYRNALELLNNRSPDATIFCLLHKSDLIVGSNRDKILNKIQTELNQASMPYLITTFPTSIWDETLYKAWSRIVAKIVPHIEQVESSLKKFCDVCGADEMALFESNTFLIMTYALGKNENSVGFNFRDDKNRFEKISAIVKQFKLSCKNSSTSMKGIEINSQDCKIFIEQFTSTAFLMVIVTDKAIQSGSLQANIKKVRPHFEKLTNV